MHTFTRIAGCVFLMLSLSFLVSALPSVLSYGHITAPTGKDVVSAVWVKACVEIEATIYALLGCKSIAELTLQVHVLVALFHGCADELLRIGAGVAITVEAKASIVACVCSIITLLAKVCVQVSVKFGLSAVLVIFAQIDVALHLILVNLNICVDGIVGVIAAQLVTVVALIVQLNLKLCIGVLAL